MIAENIETARCNITLGQVENYLSDNCYQKFKSNCKYG